MSKRTVNGVDVNMSTYDRERFDKGLFRPKYKKANELKDGENETLTETVKGFKGDVAKTK